MLAELQARAATDPAWQAVLDAYLAGLAQYPGPFQPRPAPPR